MNSLIIACNLLRRIFAERKGWITHIVLPIASVSIILGIIGSWQGNGKTPIAVANEDGGVFGTWISEQLDTEQFEPIFVEEAELRELVLEGDLSLGIIIPKDFSASLLEGEALPVQHIYMYKTEKGVQLELALNTWIRQLSLTIHTVDMSMGTTEDADARMESIAAIWTQQTEQGVSMNVHESNLYLNNTLFLIIGCLLFLVMNSSLSSIGLVLEERKLNTMARMYTAPIRSFEIASGNFLGSYVLGLIQIVATLAVTMFGFGYDYGIGFFPLLIVLNFFLLASVGISSTLASVVKQRNNLAQMNGLIITPTCMIGGCWWPISIMPEFLQKMAHFVPQRWAIDAAEKLSAGEALVDVSIHLGVLLLFAVIFLSLGAVVLRPNQTIA